MNIMMAYFANLAEMSGGLERTLCQLSNALHERGHNILIAVYNDRNAPPFYPLNSSIRVIDLNNQHYSRKLGLKDKISREWYRLWGERIIFPMERKTESRSFTKIPSPL